MTKLRRIFCHIGWHKPNHKITVSGVLLKSTCRYCGKSIMRDSQGNWFEFDAMEVGTWTYRNGEPLTGGVCESDIIYCSRCHKPTHVKIHTWIENGMKYGKAINVRECPNCGAIMER